MDYQNTVRQSKICQAAEKQCNNKHTSAFEYHHRVTIHNVHSQCTLTAPIRNRETPVLHPKERVHAGISNLARATSW